MDLDCVETEEEVFAETVVGDFFREVGVGGGDDADVHFLRLRRADAFHLADFKDPQELRLQVVRDVRDFVEEESSAVGEFEPAYAVGLCIGECAFDVSKEFAFENTFRESARIDGDSGFDARSEMACSVRATTSFPVPGSPVIRTLASDGPTREINCSTGCIAGDSAIISGLPSARRRRFSASSRCPLRRASLNASLRLDDAIEGGRCPRVSGRSRGRRGASLRQLTRRCPTPSSR